MSECVFVCLCECVCVRAWVRVCVRARACVCVRVLDITIRRATFMLLGQRFSVNFRLKYFLCKN